MLQEVCENIHNYFIKQSLRGKHEIVDGVVSLPSVSEGQRILIIGSSLNDGMYTYHSYGLKDDDDTEVVGLLDETFAGTICALAVPPAVIALSGEIKKWVEKYGDVVNSPYESESVIGVYSYTKAGNRYASENSKTSWQQVFAEQLNRWRKVAF